jgi:hypothetical protein
MQCGPASNDGQGGHPYGIARASIPAASMPIPAWQRDTTAHAGDRAIPRVSECQGAPAVRSLGRYRLCMRRLHIDGSTGLAGVSRNVTRAPIRERTVPPARQSRLFGVAARAAPMGHHVAGRAQPIEDHFRTFRGGGACHEEARASMAKVMNRCQAVQVRTW